MDNAENDEHHWDVDMERDEEGPPLSQEEEAEPRRKRRVRMPSPVRINVPEPPSSQASALNTNGKESLGVAFNISDTYDSTKVKPRDVWKRRSEKLKSTLGNDVQWIADRWTLRDWKPAVRCAICGWLSLVLLVIPKVEATMGQASFLILIASFLSPPNDPFVATLEREFIILTCAASAYAWTCLGAKLASLARSEIITNPDINAVFAGQYIEAGPSIICGAFLFVGVVVFLYIRARKGPGPFIFATVLGCVFLDISFTTAALFPYPYYTIGKAVMIPLTFHSAIAILCSFLIFPQTINAQFATNLRSVFVPLSQGISSQPQQLSLPINSDELDPLAFAKNVTDAEGALAGLSGSARLMQRDVSWGLFGAQDLTGLRDFAERLVIRANGMAYYFKVLDPVRERFPRTPAFSRATTPIETPSQSRAASVFHDIDRAETEVPPTPAPSIASSPATRRVAPHYRPHIHHQHRHISLHHQLSHFQRRHPLHEPSHSHSGSHHHRHHQFQFLLHSSLLHEALDRSQESAVGVFESQKYCDLEKRDWRPDGDFLSERAMHLVGESTKDLLDGCAGGLSAVVNWLEEINLDRFWRLDPTKGRWEALLSWRADGRARKRRWEEVIAGVEDAKDRLNRVYREFEEGKRHIVLNPYRNAFDSDHLGTPTERELPPHRYLFQSYIYQHHLMQFAKCLGDMLEEITNLHKKRCHSRLWLPTNAFKDLFSWKRLEPTGTIGRDDDEDPNTIPGIDDDDDRIYLSDTRLRDPDALPPKTILEAFGNMVFRLILALGHGNTVYALKAGVLTILLSIPTFLQKTAQFAYTEKFIWGIFMGQLTLSRFRGETTFGLTARIFSTFVGGLIGTALWYISAGSGKGNAFGLAAVCAVCFPFFFFVRLYWPIPPMTNIIFFVTINLIIGYSWQDNHLVTFSNPGVGFNVAWRRFALVTVGVTAAFIFSFLPPSTTLRRYIRASHATTVAELGSLYCDIVSCTGSTNKSLDSPETALTLKAYIALRMKLKRISGLTPNVVYEISLRGRWPTERYAKIGSIQMDIAHLLGHLRSVIDRLEPAWAYAFLQRTRFLESDFQGDLLAVITMISNALRTGAPLPQITPCPLLDRFTIHHHGLNIFSDEAEDDYGLPRTLTIDTLENLQYVYFCVGVATAYGIVTRLDRLMLATKELVGEQYHIDGIQIPRAPSAHPRSPGTSLRGYSQV